MIGYDDLTQGTAAGDYTKGGYGGSSQAPNKSAGSGPGKGSVNSSPGLYPGIVVSYLRQGYPRVSGTECYGEQLPFLLGVSVSSGTTGLPDMTGSVYNKTQVRVCKGGQIGQRQVQFSLIFSLFSLSFRLLTSKDFTQGLLHLSACPLPWVPLGLWPLELPLAMPLRHSCTSCLHTSSPTPSCCTTTYRRMPR